MVSKLDGVRICILVDVMIWNLDGARIWTLVDVMIWNLDGAVIWILLGVMIWNLDGTGIWILLAFIFVNFDGTRIESWWTLIWILRGANYLNPSIRENLKYYVGGFVVMRLCALRCVDKLQLKYKGMGCYWLMQGDNRKLSEGTQIMAWHVNLCEKHKLKKFDPKLAWVMIWEPLELVSWTRS